MCNTVAKLVYEFQFALVKPVLMSLLRYMNHLDIDRCVCEEQIGKLDLN